MQKIHGKNVKKGFQEILPLSPGESFSMAENSSRD
jgi:hypothetical protein